MKQVTTILISAILIMATGLLIWTAIPDSREERQYLISPESPIFSKNMECEGVNNLLGVNITVIFPRSIHNGGSGVVQVEIEKAENEKHKKDSANETETCGISLEVWIDGVGVVAEPGTKILKPYLDVPSQKIKLDLFPVADQLIKGTIWISAVFKGKNQMILERIPIIAVPVNIKVHSLFGSSIKHVRNLSICLITLSLLLSLFLLNVEKKRR